jgi:hypothetical protein
MLSLLNRHFEAMVADAFGLKSQRGLDVVVSAQIRNFGLATLRTNYGDLIFVVHKYFNHKATDCIEVSKTTLIVFIGNFSQGFK